MAAPTKTSPPTLAVLSYHGSLGSERRRKLHKEAKERKGERKDKKRYN